MSNVVRTFYYNDVVPSHNQVAYWFTYMTTIGGFHIGSILHIAFFAIFLS